MKKNLLLSPILLLLGLALTSCARDVVGGNPTILLANTNGTSQAFSAPESQVNHAITNAFYLLNYHGMLLLEANNSGADYLAPNWHPTNGFILYQNDPIANIPLDSGISAPYLATFYVQLQALKDVSQTKVTVRTLQAEVIDGAEQGAHGGRANHHRKIAPVQQEEEKVLGAIAKELNAMDKANLR